MRSRAVLSPHRLRLRFLTNNARSGVNNAFNLFRRSYRPLHSVSIHLTSPLARRRASSMTSHGKDKVQPTDQDDLLPALSANNSMYDHECILEDIDGCIHAAVPGFFEKFFDGKSWSSASQEVASSVDLDNLKTSLSELESSTALSQLLLEVLKLSGKDVRYCAVQPPPTQLPSRLRDPIALFSVKRSSEPEPEVVGVFCPQKAPNYKDGLLELCRNARALFSRRSDRLFVHGFYIFGNIMECWIFDRSGIYSCEPFNVVENPKRFLTIMAAYVLMSEQEWGRSTLIQEDSEGIYVALKEDAEGPGKTYLQTPPFYIVDNDKIVGGGLLCHRGRSSSTEPWNLVVKYKWKPAWHEPEAAQLKKARDRHVWGVVQFHSYEVIDTTENLRRGLFFGPPQKFKEDMEVTDRTAKPQPLEADLGSFSKHDDVESDEKSAAVIGAEALLETFHENRPNLAKSPGFRSTIFSCLIISPPGLPIFEYTSLHQLLEVLCDAIKAHRSLYQDGGILHRDIAASNIIIPPLTTSAGSPKGMLIDLDTAWDISRGSTPQGSLVGTSPFMAIGALEAHVKNNPRTYRHDLEAFFYVFIFLAICPRGADGTKAKELPSTSRLLKWKLDKKQQVRKTADMEEEGFQKVLEEFSPEFESLKGLAEKLRVILFPVKDGNIWTWTDMSPEGTNKLYDDMIGAFEDALAFLAKL